MQLKSIVVSWLLSAPYLAAGQTTIGSLFRVNLDDDKAGGCAARSGLLSQYLQESKDLASAGLQAIQHAQDPSAAQHDVAKRYLQAYFAVEENDATALAFAKDIAWDTDGNDIWAMGENGEQHPLSIEVCEEYGHLFWDYDDKKRIWAKNERVPYWSDDLSQYLADEDYDGHTFCTVPGGANMGATQHMTTPPTVTLCPASFTESTLSTKLGSKNPHTRQKGGKKLTELLPRSATLYHELYHLVLGHDPTPDTTYVWARQQLLIKEPDEIISEDYEDKYDDEEGPLPPGTYGMTRAEAIRHNPESYVFFSVGYWYFMQTKWSNGDDSQRWSFHSGVSQKVKIP
ncbi:hypothetical protein BDV12DRAFT_206994 [Aspergillus spectabilis]